MPWTDIRYALRLMRRSPGFTAVAVLSLALGIGANTAIFSLLNTLILRPLPVRDPATLVELLFKAPAQEHFNAFSYRSYEHYRDHNHVFSGLVAFSFSPFGLSGDGLAPETVRGLYVTGTYFPVLGVQPALGRLIGPEDAGSSASVAVVSWNYWKSRLKLDRAVLGRRIFVDGFPVTVVGVAPRDFVGLEPGLRPDIWVPTAMDALVHHPSYASTARYWLKLAARLKPGVSLEQARAEMAVLFQWTIEDEFRTNNDRTVRDWKSEVQPAGAGLSRLRDQFARPALVLMALVAILLLIACINVASLLLARGAGRQREMAVRVSLGAGRLRLMCQGLTESLMLAAPAGAIGVLLAFAITGVLVRIIASGREGIELQVKPDPLVLLFTAGIALLSGLLFGVAPAWRACRSAAASGLRQTGKGGETRMRRLFGKGLVVAQIGFSIVLLSAASLFVRHLTDLGRVDLGFRRDHVLLMSLDSSNSGYDRERLIRAYQELLGRLEAIPGVRSASMCAFFPMAGVGSMRPASVEGYQASFGERRFLSQSWVAPKYFQTLGMPLLMGRDFSFDDQARSRVAIVNRTFSRYFFGSGSPLGKHITFDGDEQPFEIVGVVGDAKSGDMRESSLRFVYFNLFQLRRNANQFALRTTVQPMSIAGEARRAVRELLKTVPVSDVFTMEDQVDSAIVPERLVAMLSGLFGGLGSALAALGLYGLLAYTVARRTGEIGVRMALGARRADITRMVLGEALGMVCAGLMTGMPVAYWGKRLAASLIPALPVSGAFPVIVGAGAMAALALLAALVPARRAMRVEPVEALRYE